MQKIVSGMIAVLILCGAVAGCKNSAADTSVASAATMTAALSKTASTNTELGTFSHFDQQEKKIYYTADIFERANKAKVGRVVVSEQDGQLEDIMVQARQASDTKEYAETILKELGVKTETIQVAETKVIDAAKMGDMVTLDADGYRMAGWTMVDSTTNTVGFSLLVKHRANVATYMEGQLTTSDFQGKKTQQSQLPGTQ